MRTKSARSRGGFSLVEVIFSIAILAITSIFVLQIFLKGMQLEKKAGDYDRALSEAQRVIESYKAYRTLDPALLNDGIFPEAVYLADGEQSFRFALGFDGDFRAVPLGEEADLLPETSSALYLLTLSAEAPEEGMQRLSVSVFRTSGYPLEPDTPQELFSLETEVFLESEVPR